MNLYSVNKQWIDGLPWTVYRGGVGAYEGVVMHYTDNPNDTAAGERAWESQNFNDAFVHEFIDPNEIIQVANPDYIAYGAGQFANARFIHLELCTAKNQDDFDGSFDMWCQRAAVYLANGTLGISPAQPDGSGTLWGHFQVTQYLGATTHMDPLDYLQKWGKTWQDVVDRVQLQYNEIKKGDEKLLDPGVSTTIIATWISPSYMATNNEAFKDIDHWYADELRRASGLLEAPAGWEFTADTANTIINTWIRKNWMETLSQDQKDYDHWLANVLRVASGQPTQ
jgi:N-acetylmuramoyl-L-alanine amidase CwlA